jgi:predicted nucleotide-binding protein
MKHGQKIYTQQPTANPNLLIPRAEAAEKINRQIERGGELAKRETESLDALEALRADKNKWGSYTTELLKRIFDQDTIAADYEYAYGPIYMRPTFPQMVRTVKEEITKKLTKLESLSERLELIPELNVQPSASSNTDAASANSRDIFIVHGHDEAAKQAVSRFIEKLGLNPIILHEQPNAGRTIIEKFEHHSDVAFAVILLTPDDAGAVKDRLEDAKPRARQNVIFELGYFVGKITRHKVCALYTGGVELPSDYHGVLFLEMDSAGAWKLQLGREMKQAGLDIDLNKAV